jgi:hypothetical protein
MKKQEIRSFVYVEEYPVNKDSIISTGIFNNNGIKRPNYLPI